MRKKMQILNEETEEIKAEREEAIKRYKEENAKKGKETKTIQSEKWERSKKLDEEITKLDSREKGLKNEENIIKEAKAQYILHQKFKNLYLNRKEEIETIKECLPKCEEKWRKLKERLKKTNTMV